MIHIADTKIARRYGDYFIRQINKIEEVGPNFKFYTHFFLFIYFKIFALIKYY